MIRIADHRADDLAEAIEDIFDDFDFDLRGHEGSLGETVRDLVAVEIQARAITEHRGAEDRWDDNAPDYAEWKARKYNVENQPNIRTGQMLSLESLRGSETSIDGNVLTMRYGTNEVPSSSVTGAIFASDKKVTDTEKANFAHDGQSSKRVKRPFYEADDAIQTKVALCVEEALQAYILQVHTG